jgi:hypothetical protein
MNYNQIIEGITTDKFFKAKALYIMQGLTYAFPLHVVANNAPNGETAALWIAGRTSLTGGQTQIVPIGCKKITNYWPAGLTIVGLN